MVEDDYEYSRDQTSSGKIITGFDSGTADESFSLKRRSIPTYRVSAIAVMACISIWGLGYICDLDPFAREPSVPESNHTNLNEKAQWEWHPMKPQQICGRYPSGFS